MSDATVKSTTWGPLAGLLLAPALTAGALLVAPRVSAGELVADVVTFAGGAIVGLVSLAVAARAVLTRRVAAFLTGAAVASLLALWLRRPPDAAAVLVNAALVTVAQALGGSLGRRIQHPGHLLPACAVAAAADVSSLIHPSGPTHAIAQSESALSVLAVAFPVPGTHLVAPVLGVGDLLFLALLLGAASAHKLSVARVALLGAAGVAVAAGLSAWLGAIRGVETAIPAIPPIALAVVLGVPAARRLRAEDRRTAFTGVGIAAAVLAGVLLRQWATPPEPAEKDGSPGPSAPASPAAP